MTPKIACLALLAAAVPLAASAQDRPQQPPESFRAVIDCRSIADTAQRVACYDSAVDRLAQAIESDDVVVTSRAEIRKARRGLFGFALPNLGIFGGDDDDGEMEEEIDSIEAAATRVSRDGVGRLVFELENAGRWRQIDNERVREVRSGETVTIRRAALGSYLAKFGQASAFRVRRVNE